jgi:hypothetical protein
VVYDDPKYWGVDTHHYKGKACGSKAAEEMGLTGPRTEFVMRRNTHLIWMRSDLMVTTRSSIKTRVIQDTIHPEKPDLVCFDGRHTDNVADVKYAGVDSLTCASKDYWQTLQDSTSGASDSELE